MLIIKIAESRRRLTFASTTDMLVPRTQHSTNEDHNGSRDSLTCLEQSFASSRAVVINDIFQAKKTELFAQSYPNV